MPEKKPVTAEPTPSLAGMRIVPKGEKEELDEKRFVFTFICQKCGGDMVLLTDSEKQEVIEYGIKINPKNKVYLCSECKILMEP